MNATFPVKNRSEERKKCCSEYWKPDKRFFGWFFFALWFLNILFVITYSYRKLSSCTEKIPRLYLSVTTVFFCRSSGCTVWSRITMQAFNIFAVAMVYNLKYRNCPVEKRKYGNNEWAVHVFIAYPIIKTHQHTVNSEHWMCNENANAMLWQLRPKIILASEENNKQRDTIKHR